MGHSLLIAGTDTDVGKTFVTAALVAYWQQTTKNSLGLLKLMQTGIGDRETYDSLFGNCDRIDINCPVRFKAPLAPPIAAEKEGATIDLGKVKHTLTALQQKHPLVVVEALGGLGSPATKTFTVAHIAAEWQLPMILVVPVRLGAISHAVANVALARSFNLDLRGIVLNFPSAENTGKLEDLTPIDAIESFTQVPVLGVLPYIEDLTQGEQLANLVADWDLANIFPD